MARLPREFYLGDTVEIARRLLGKYLLRRLPGGQTLACRITETEAYIGRCDKACHAYNYRRTARTETLFAPPGHAYIYLIYGMHHCLNFVTEPENEPAAVLIRAAEPVGDPDPICRLRYGTDYKDLSAYQRKNFLNGPGKLCKGLSLTRAEDRMDLTGNTLFVCDEPTEFGFTPLPAAAEKICCGPRIGIDYAEEAVDFPWRFRLEREDSV